METRSFQAFYRAISFCDAQDFEASSPFPFPDFLGVAKREGHWAWMGAADRELSYRLNFFSFVVRSFNGYGESLVDYSRHVWRLPVGPPADAMRLARHVGHGPILQA